MYKSFRDVCILEVQRDRFIIFLIKKKIIIIHVFCGDTYCFLPPSIPPHSFLIKNAQFYLGTLSHMEMWRVCHKEPSVI